MIIRVKDIIGKRYLYLLLINVFEQLLDSCFKLEVGAGDDGLREVEDTDVRIELSTLEVVTLIITIADDWDTEDHGRILECLPVDRTHGARNTSADELAEALMLVNPWGTVSVAVVTLGLDHDTWMVVATAWHIARDTATDDLLEVVMT